MVSLCDCKWQKNTELSARVWKNLAFWRWLTYQKEPEITFSALEKSPMMNTNKNIGIYIAIYLLIIRFEFF